MFGKLQPDVVQPVDVFRPQPRRMRPQVHVDTMRRSGLMISSENGCRGSGSRLPGQADAPRQLLARSCARNAGHQARRLQRAAVCTMASNGFDAGHHQQFHRLALFLRHGHHAAEQLLFVVAEKLVVRAGRIRRRRSIRAAPSSPRCRAAAGWSSPARASGASAAVIAHRHQHAARPRVQRSRRRPAMESRG